MFATHQPLLARAAQDDLRAFINVAAFAIISARSLFPRAVEDAAKWSSGQRKGLQSIFAWKHLALDYLEEQAEARQKAVFDAYTGKPTEALAIMLREWHGYGLVKGGFVLQMMTGQVGCIDTRNLDYFELDARTVRSPSSPSSRQALKHAKAYVTLCDNLGGSEKLWNVWCEYLAETTTVHEWKDNPDAVSAAHCYATGVSIPKVIEVRNPEVAHSDIPF